jgi:tetratricopeptide (TPR) repeat protein
MERSTRTASELGYGIETTYREEALMKGSHVSDGAFARFLGAQASEPEARDLLLHLSGGCPDCSERAHRAMVEVAGSPRPHGRPGWSEAYAGLAPRGTSSSRGMDRLRAWERWALLEPFPQAARLDRIDSDPDFQNQDFLDRLVEASRWALREEPAEAVEVLRLAIRVTDSLDPADHGGDPRLADLKATTWALLGNALRVAQDFEGARRAFQEVWRLAGRGTHDPLHWARNVSLEASFLKDIGEYEIAEAALEDTLEAHRQVGDLHGQGRIYLQMGEVIGHVHPERGISHIERALELLEVSREPRLAVAARHALAWFLNDAGRSEEALDVIEAAGPLYEQSGENLILLRRRWLEARIAHGFGRHEEAEKMLRQVWDEFQARGLHQEVVFVSIDLARVLTARGELAQAAELAERCWSIMRHWRLHRFALAAWLVFQNALAQGRVVGDFFLRVERYFRRYWARPGEFQG